ncbi:MAG TPA: HIT domain-containing protein [Candidatus Dormibacteraeota bacterium]|jgi:ATP adenylyltransferase|nr:HIT domain-containing protein [Candidatus Dormibacteraeota bacterium]
MKRLWAPWRMEYVAGEQKPGCLFCRVIENPDDEDAALVIWRPEGAIVILNKFPYNPGHAMVAPVAHVPSLEELDDPQTTQVMRAVRRTVEVLRGTMTPDGFNIGANIGRAAGAGIPDHVHFHVVPRWNGDTNFMAVIDDVKVVNEALTQTAAKLRKAFSSS